MFFAGAGKDELRRRYVEAWRRRRENLPLEPLDAAIADVVALHPEYHAMLEAAAVGRDYAVESGETNPFLHMGLHLALREQVATDRPQGITAVHSRLQRRLGSLHDAEHSMFDVLARVLWEAQRAGRPPDEAVYLERLRSL
jgi:hypothetical protein